MLTIGSGGATFISSVGTGSGCSNGLSFASIGRNSGGTVNFSPGGNLRASVAFGTAANEVTFGNTLPLINGILPWATVGTGSVQPTDFATANNPGQPNSFIQAYTGYVGLLAAAGPTDNVKISASEALTLNKTVNSLIIVGAITVNESSYNLNITSGGLLNATAASTSTITGGTIAFGSSEGIITTAAGGTTAIQSPITGTGGVTYFGTGTVTMAGPNAYTGVTTLDGSVLSLGAGTAFRQTATDTLVINSGTIQGTASISIPNNFSMTNAQLTLGSTFPVAFTGAGTLSGFNTLTGTTTGGTYFNGPISGAGSTLLTIAGAGQITFNGSNSYAGITTLTGTGTVVLGNNNALGTSLLNIAAAANIIAANTNVTLNNNYEINGAAITFTGDSSITFNGNGTAIANSTLTVNNSTTLAGTLSGGGGS